MTKKAVADKERCKSCALCIGNCPREAIALTENLNQLGYKYVFINDEKCIGCGICYTVCPDGVFEIIEFGGE